MEGIKEAIDDLNYNELKALEKSLKGGAIKSLIREKIEEIDRKNARVCATCGKYLDAFSLTNFSLMFGPEDFKKRASFCAFDCLEHFIGRLKKLHKKFNESGNNGI